MVQAHSRIYGSGFVTGEVLVPNERLTLICDTTSDWIKERSGIEQRYFVNEGTATSDLAVGAAKKALDDAGWKASEVDYIVVATMTPDYYFPGVGSLVQAKLGIGNIPALDIRQQCSGFIYGLQICDALVRANVAKKILFIGAEIHSGFMPWSKLDLCGAGQFTLLTGIGGEGWIAAAKVLMTELNLPIRSHLIGPRQAVEDHLGDWARARETDDAGCVLVRPDQHVAWRAAHRSSDPLTDLRRALRHVLALGDV